MLDPDHMIEIAKGLCGDATTLADKAEGARAFLRSATKGISPQDVAVAWTGGKDSTLVLALWREVLSELGQTAPARAVSVDTGCKFAEVVQFRDALANDWGLDLHVARPRIDLETYPLAQDKIACCADLKIAPLQEALARMNVRVLLTGIRADEHASRQDRLAAEACDTPPHIRLNPILHFSEMDVWAYHMDQDLPHCCLYDEGYRSLGCVPCTAPAGALETERAGRDAAKDDHLETLHSLGYF